MIEDLELKLRHFTMTVLTFVNHFSRYMNLIRSIIIFSLQYNVY